jgi:NADPH-dependent 7-cyano-7-deazaguanine reductase QueF
MAKQRTLMVKMLTKTELPQTIPMTTRQHLILETTEWGFRCQVTRRDTHIYGNLRIEYDSDGVILELTSFRTWLRRLKRQAWFLETYVEHLQTILLALLHPKQLTITATLEQEAFTTTCHVHWPKADEKTDEKT